MTHPPTSSSVNSSDTPTDSLDKLGQSAADLATVAGDHASLLCSEANLRIRRTVRDSLLSLACSATAVLASIVGYILLVREVAYWLAESVGVLRPSVLTVGIYLLATILPLVLLKLRARWNTERDLGNHERRYQTS